MGINTHISMPSNILPPARDRRSKSRQTISSKNRSIQEEIQYCRQQKIDRSTNKHAGMIYLRRVLVPFDSVTAGGGDLSRFPKPRVAARDLFGDFFLLLPPSPALSARFAVFTRTWVKG